MMVPVGSLVVLRGTPKDELLKDTAFLVWPGLLAPVVAPLVGGALTQYLSWHWIFLVDLPLGAAALVAALRLVPPGGGDPGRRLDWPGLGLTTAGVAAVVVGLELLGLGGEAGTGCARGSWSRRFSSAASASSRPRRRSSGGSPSRPSRC